MISSDTGDGRDFPGACLGFAWLDDASMQSEGEVRNRFVSHPGSGFGDGTEDGERRVSRNIVGRISV